MNGPLIDIARTVLTETRAAFTGLLAAGPETHASLLRSIWDVFNNVIAFTANIWQNIDGLFFTGVGIYLIIRLSKSVLGHDESTVKTSTSFDYLGEFSRESDHKVFRLEDVWKLPFQEKTVRACYSQATEEQPFLCIPNHGVWLALHDFYSGGRNDSVFRAADLGQAHALRRVSHVIGITFGNYETRQARIEDLGAPKLLSILRDPMHEFQKAAISSRNLETARQLALLELAALVCWKAPHILADALMEPELTRDALLASPGRTPIDKKNNLEKALAEKHRAEYDRLLARGLDLGRLILLNRQQSYLWLNSIPPTEAGGEIPPLTPEEQALVSKRLLERERFKPWTHRMVDAISRLPWIRKRFPHEEYVQAVGRLEANGWFIRVYVNHLE